MILSKKTKNIEELMRLADDHYDKEEYEEALRLYLKTIDDPSDVSPQTQYKIGRMYAKGLGTEADANIATWWYEKAASAGYIDAQFNLGYLYVEIRLLSDAFLCFSKCAQSGDAEAQNNVGDFYYTGISIEQSYEKALEWYQKAAIGGNADGLFMTGVMLYNGESVTADKTAGLEKIKKAAELGSETAQKYLTNPREGKIVVTDYAD
jgi:TPR repeat protein